MDGNILIESEEQNSDLEYVLEKEFGKENVELLDNGMYQARKDDITFYIPLDTTNISNAVVWYPDCNGAAWNGNSLATVIERCSGDNPPNCIVAVSDWDNYNKGSVNSYEKLKEVMSNCNIELDKGLGVGFSGSGLSVLRDYSAVAAGDEEWASHWKLFDLEGAWVGEDNKDKCNANTLSALIANGTEVWMIKGNYKEGKSAYLTELEYLNSLGVNTGFIEGDSGDHQKVNVDFFHSGLIDYLLDNIDELMYNPYYAIYKLVDGELIEVDLSSLKFKNEEGLEGADGSKPKIVEIPFDLEKNYSYLKDLDEKIVLNSFDKIGNSSLASNLSYVTNVMSNLKSKIKNSGFLNRTVHYYPSNPYGVPGCISGYLNKYYNMMGDFMGKLNEEIDAITSIAQSFVDMDIYLSEQGQELVGNEPSIKPINVKE